MDEDSAEKQRTVRLRETKRRYRARKREYVESLQQQLVETRDQQVGGMQQVQLAAQKVVKDNSRLRTLLRLMGVEDIVVESWLRAVETPTSLTPVHAALRSCSTSSKPPTLSNVSNKSTQTCADLLHVPSPNGSFPCDAAPNPVTSLPRNGNIPTHQVASLLNKSHSSTSEISNESRPCLSVPHILAQPNIESPEDADLAPGEVGSGDVECSRAQKMVLPFAITNNKVDAISEKLKEGCVSDKRGGCKVKAEVMWEILDDVMNEA